MQIKIFYCNSWNFRPKASRLEDELINNFPGVEVSKEIGNKGDFIVEVDGKVIYNNHDFPRPRFPDAGEVTEIIKKEFNI